MKKILSLFIGLLTLSTMFAAVGAPLVLTPIQTILGNDQELGADFFGDHVVTWRGDDNSLWVFIGAPRMLSPRLERDGGVYVYRQLSPGAPLVFMQFLEPEGNAMVGTFGDRLGSSLAVTNGRLLVAAGNDQEFTGIEDPIRAAMPTARATLAPDFKGEDPRPGFIGPSTPFQFAGKVYTYELSNGVWHGPLQKLQAPSPGSFQGFGGRTDSNGIAMNSAGNMALITETGCCSLVASLHVFQYADGIWTRLRTIDAAPSVLQQLTGNSSHNKSLPGKVVELAALGDAMALVGDNHFLVSAHVMRNANSLRLGMAYLLQVNNVGRTEYRQTLIDPLSWQKPQDCFDHFGESGMAAGGGNIVIAQPCVSVAGVENAGSLSVYGVSLDQENPLTLTAEIPHPFPTFGALWGANFGGGAQSVDINDEYLVAAGAIGNWFGGEVYLFRQAEDRWSLTATLALPDGGNFLSGQSVKLLGNGLIGVSEMGSGGLGGGRMHIFDTALLD